MTRKELEKRCREEMQQNIPDRDALWSRIEQGLPERKEPIPAPEKPRIRMQQVYRVMLTAACLMLVVAAGGVVTALGGMNRMETAKSDNAVNLEQSGHFDDAPAAEAEDAALTNDGGISDNYKKNAEGVQGAGIQQEYAADAEAAADEEVREEDAEAAPEDSGFTSEDILLYADDENIADSSLILRQTQPVYDRSMHLYWDDYYISTAFLRQYVDPKLTFDGTDCIFRTGTETIRISGSVASLTNDLNGDDGTAEIGYFDMDGERYYHVTDATAEIFHLSRSANGIDGYQEDPSGNSVPILHSMLTVTEVPYVTYSVDLRTELGTVYHTDTYRYQGEDALTTVPSTGRIVATTLSGAVIFQNEDTFLMQFDGQYYPLTLTDSQSSDVPK